VYLQVSTPLNERDVDDSDMIFIHPQSQFYLDIQDDSRSLSLAPFPDNRDIRFPTRTAFLDAMIAMMLDPPFRPGVWQIWHVANMLVILLFHLHFEE
jgi:hypothetical protein